MQIEKPKKIVPVESDAIYAKDENSAHYIRSLPKLQWGLGCARIALARVAFKMEKINFVAAMFERRIFNAY